MYGRTQIPNRFFLDPFQTPATQASFFLALAHSPRRPNLSQAPIVSVRSPRHFFISSFPIFFFVIIVWQIK